MRKCTNNNTLHHSSCMSRFCLSTTLTKFYLFWEKSCICILLEQKKIDVD